MEVFILMSNAGYFGNIAPWKNITTETIGSNKFVKIPKFYVKYVASSRPTWYVSAAAQDGYEVHPAFIRGTNEMSCFYMGQYASTNGTTATSVAGNSVVNMSLNTSKTAAEAVGAGYHLVNIYEWMAVALLMTIEMGGPDMQTLIASGTGVSYGASSNSTSGSNWRGLYSLWGHNREWVDGLKHSNGTVSVFNPTSVSGKTYNYTTTSAKVPTSSCWWEGFASDSSTSTPNKYIKYLFLPSAGAASETASATGDYMWSNTSSDRVCLMGGGSDCGSECGMFYFALYYDASDSYVTYGFRLAKYGDNLS